MDFSLVFSYGYNLSRLSGYGKVLSSGPRAYQSSAGSFGHGFLPAELPSTIKVVG